VEEYYRLYPEWRDKRRATLFLDEIQIIPGWELFARRLAGQAPSHLSGARIEMAPDRKNLHNFLEFRRFLEKYLGTKIDLGIENTLKPAIKNAIKNEIIYV
jgi:hypothetical protein